VAVRSGHTAVQAELRGYLRRAGHDGPAPPDAPGPWADALGGRWRRAADGWRALSERYEEAVELAGSGDAGARAAGLAILTELGATATLDRLGPVAPAGTPRGGLAETARP
jgi:hypothetical protein